MAISSIHIMRAIAAAIIHNSRDNYSKSVVFFDEENELWNDTKTAYQIYKEELAKRTLAYTKRTKQKLQKTAVTHLSAVVNLEQHHTLKDLEKIKEELEKVFDTKVFQMAIHRDEGKIKHKVSGEYLVSGIDFFYNPDDKKYYTKKDKNIYSNELNINDYIIEKNYHAHIELMGLDSQGQAIRQKMNRFVLSNLQDFTAETLNMQRGNNYQIKKSVKRLDTHDFKKLKKVENELKKISTKEKNKIVEKANQIIEGGNETIRKQKEDKKKLKEELEELKKANNQLREELKDNKDLSTRVNFKKQEDLNKELQAELKDNKIDLPTALEKIEELKKEIFNNTNENKELKEKVDSLENENKSLQEQNKALDSKVIDLEEKIVSSAFIIARLEQKLKDIISFANEKIKSLFQYKVLNNYNLEKSRNWKTFINAEREDYWNEIVYYNSKEIDDNYKKNLGMELIKIDDVENIEDKKSTGIEKENIEEKEIKEIELKENKENIEIEEIIYINR